MNWLGAVIVMAALCTAAACNQPGCAGVRYDPEPNDPLIKGMSYLGQEDGNPWTVLLAMEFSSPKGAVGGGDVFFYANSQKSAAPMALSNYFSASDVSLTATEGLVAIPLPFTQVGFDDDATVRLGTQIVDADNRPSNCYTIDLNFTLGTARLWLRDKLKDLGDARRRV